MPFSESLKARIRKRALVRCCICHSFGVDIHHIIPEAEEGPNTEDNAAPLCRSCHDLYGANPDKRKQIREARDVWYNLCDEAFLGSTQLKDIANDLKNLATKEDIERLAVRNFTYVLGSSENNMKSSPNYQRYSFIRQEFIHPLIIRELRGWLSDRGETISSVNLVSANRSNQFHGEFNVNERDERLWVEWEGSKTEYFIYSHIATSPSGVEIVESYDRGGGSGVFGSVGLFCFEYDRALENDSAGKMTTRERVILKSLGSIGLGDRYKGEITYEDGFLIIGPDHGWFNRGQETVRKIPIQ